MRPFASTISLEEARRRLDAAVRPITRTERAALANAAGRVASADVGSSLELTSDVLRLDPFRRAVRDARLKVLNGEELSTSLDTTRRFAPDVIAIVNSGEETGKLPESLDKPELAAWTSIARTILNLHETITRL